MGSLNSTTYGSSLGRSMPLLVKSKAFFIMAMSTCPTAEHGSLNSNMSGIPKFPKDFKGKAHSNVLEV